MKGNYSETIFFKIISQHSRLYNSSNHFSVLTAPYSCMTVPHDCMAGTDYALCHSLLCWASSTISCQVKEWRVHQSEMAGHAVIAVEQAWCKHEGATNTKEYYQWSQHMYKRQKLSS